MYTFSGEINKSLFIPDKVIATDQRNLISEIVSLIRAAYRGVDEGLLPGPRSTYGWLCHRRKVAINYLYIFEDGSGFMSLPSY